MLLYYSQTVSAIATATCDLRAVALLRCAVALLLFEAITVYGHFHQVLKKHPEIDKELSLIKDCVTKEDLQAQEEAPIVASSIPDKI